MSAFKRLFYRFFRPYQTPPEPVQSYALDAELHAWLQQLAEQQKRPLDEVANELLQQARLQRSAEDANLKIWSALSPRQQQIAALVCSDYTNQEIASRLNISPETVKSHMRSILREFDVHSKSELRRRLAGWDFSLWNSSG